ncbi:hypothetical protein Cgig2_018782 [Carnegiea gigantea]|uniref:Uncharacterized protein n=1 Tax=Carnegiea gigantea TaxID=171969 RepID=A0A9Q1JJD6_9CARY|nr:hypothetical protein Cgig2_018782 [Carnegiea gigantea]
MVTEERVGGKKTHDENTFILVTPIYGAQPFGFSFKPRRMPPLSLLPPHSATSTSASMESLCFNPSPPLPPPFSLIRRGLRLLPDHRRRSRPFTISATAASNSTATVASAEDTLAVKPESRPPAALKRISADSLQYQSGFLGATPDKSFASAGDASPVSAMEYLTNILSSKVYDVAVESPLQFAERLSETLGTNVFLKREDLQPALILIIERSERTLKDVNPAFLSLLLLANGTPASNVIDK